MTAAPLTETQRPTATLSPALIANMNRFSRIELADDDTRTGWKIVSLTRADAPDRRHPVFCGTELDARIFLARVAVRFPHLKTNLPKVRFPLQEVSP